MAKQVFITLKKYSYLLLCALFFYGVTNIVVYFNKQNFIHKKVINEIESELSFKEDKFVKIIQNSRLLHSLIFDKSNQNDSLQKLNFGIYIYKNSENNKSLIYWNNSEYFIDSIHLNSCDTSYILNIPRGIFKVIHKNKIVSDMSYGIKAICPLQENYTPKNQLVSFKINGLDDDQKKFTIDTTFSKYPLLQKIGKTQLFLQDNLTVPGNCFCWLSILLGFFAAFFFFHYLDVVTKIISKYVSFNIAFYSLFFILMICRICLFYSIPPFDIKDLGIFDPAIYASNFISASLGDLMVNLFILVWLVGLLKHNPYFSKRKLDNRTIYFITFSNIFLFTSCVLLIKFIIQSLVFDSKISFEVLNFFSLNEYSLAGFGALSLLAVFLLRITNLFWKVIFKYSIPLYIQILFIITCGLFIILIFGKPKNQYLNLIVLLWIIVYVYIINHKTFKTALANKSFSVILFTILYTSVSFASLMVFQNYSLEKEQRFKMAERLASEFADKSVINKYNNLKADKALDESQNIGANLYSYAMYYNQEIVTKTGDFPFQSNIKLRKEQQYYNENNFSILEYHANKNLTLIIVKQNENWLAFLTLFNTFFICFLLIAAILFAIPNLLKLNFLKIKDIFYATIRAQILSIILVSSISSFIFIGVITLNYFNQKYISSVDKKLLISKSTVIKSFNSLLLKANDSSQGKGEDQVNNLLIPILGQQHKFTFYGNNGQLIYSNLKEEKVTNYIPNTLINPLVYFELKDKNISHFITDENYEKQSFKSIYFPITTQNNRIVGYCHIPYLNTQNELEQETNGLIAALLNITALIFILSFTIIFYLANKIVEPFTMIGNKMKAVSLDGNNDTIIWTQDDEIGKLIKEYNGMVVKLDISAKALAASEREVAWKEMAKQIAHEIKNPLTPMKLSIQYLQNALENKNQDSVKLTQKVSKILMEQIDQLSNIANEFAQFANISNANFEILEINEILESHKNLYNIGDGTLVTFELSRFKTFIYADKLQIMRLFTNLIKNALEATAHLKNKQKISIQLTTVNNKVRIAVKDNGEGILEENMHLIFTPNFTTKTSGSGLGLAICKGIVENANGKIWFECKTNETTFFVEFPLSIKKN